MEMGVGMGMGMGMIRFFELKNDSCGYDGDSDSDGCRVF